MQCDDCKEIYRADNTNQPCPKCGGKGSVLENISHIYGNRAERRRAMKAKLPMEKYFSCPECSKAKL